MGFPRFSLMLTRILPAATILFLFSFGKAVWTSEIIEYDRLPQTGQRITTSRCPYQLEFLSIWPASDRSVRSQDNPIIVILRSFREKSDRLEINEKGYVQSVSRLRGDRSASKVHTAPIGRGTWLEGVRFRDRLSVSRIV